MSCLPFTHISIQSNTYTLQLRFKDIKYVMERVANKREEDTDQDERA